MYTNQIEAWETRLSIVQRHLQPWTSTKSGIPPWFREDPYICDLVHRIEHRIVQLMLRVGLSSGSNHQAESVGIKSIEAELDEIIELSRQFDRLLQQQVSLEIWNDPILDSSAPAP